MVSCQQDLEPANVGGEVNFQLSVSADELATRAGDTDQQGANSAYGAIDYLQGVAANDGVRVDWKDVDLRYTLEVYDYDENGVYDANFEPVKDRQVIIVDEYQPVNFDLRLVPNRDYHFVVFADFVAQGASNEPKIDVQAELGKRHTIGATLKDIKVKEDAINDEIADAYFATLDVLDITAAKNNSVELKRPYAKLRVIATDLAELNLNVDPGKVIVEYTAGHPTAFNALTGAVDLESVNKVYVYDYNAEVTKSNVANHVYTDGYEQNTYTNADGVVRHTHLTLFTDYILANAEQSAIHFNMEVRDKKNVTIKKTAFNTDIPVQRNYLTTVVGNVLTLATDINVTINDNFEDEFVVYPGCIVTNANEFNAALADSYDTIIFGDTIRYPGLGFVVDRSVDLRMNNQILDAGSNANSQWYALQITGRHNVNIYDANFIHAGVAASAGCNVVFHNGVIDHNPDRSSRYIFYATGEGTTFTVKDGAFYNDRSGNKFFAAQNGAVIYVEGGNFGGVSSTDKVYTSTDGKVIISGGTFNFDPTKWLASGYTATKNGSTWTVSKL